MDLTRPHRCLATVLLALLAACGGGGGGGSGTTDLAGGGIGGTGISTGPITATGSVTVASVAPVAVSAVTASAVVPTITVNSVRFELPGTDVTLNGQPAAAADLRIGQVVTVHFTGDATTGTATAEVVTYDPDLTAPVEAVDVAGGRVQILGVWVSVNTNDTLLAAGDDENGEIAPTSILMTIQPGDLVEISGARDADGQLHATRIERKGRSTDPTAPVAVEVEGQITDLASDSLGFTLGTLTVVVPQGLVIDGALANGVEVDLKGALSGTTLTASAIEVKGNPVEGQAEGSRVELDGFITAVDRLDTDDEIEVDGVVVRLTSATKIRRDESGMATRADLDPNVEVEVEGSADGSGAVVAERITLDG